MTQGQRFRAPICLGHRNDGTDRRCPARTHRHMSAGVWHAAIAKHQDLAWTEASTELGQ